MKAAAPLAELALGILGFTGALTLEKVAALAVATATVLALLPLIIWRWKALLTGQPKRVPKSDEKP